MGIASEEAEAGFVYGRAERCHRRWYAANRFQKFP